MIKFTAAMKEGRLYGFGLSEANLNRLEFNAESIFFDFGYAGNPNIFGLILYLEQFAKPQDINANIDLAISYCEPFFNLARGVTPETLRFFPISRSVMQRLRSTPFWGFETQIEIFNPADIQLFFAGKTEQDIENYLEKAGLLTRQTKRTQKGFGKIVD